MKDSMMIHTMCARDCPDACWLDATVEKSILTRVEASRDNPFTNGITCPRALGDPARTNSVKRILFPYIKNPKTEGGYKRVGWDLALDAVVESLREAIDDYGRESVLLLDYAGNTGVISNGYSKRIWNALGVTMTDYSICSASGHAGIGLHYGLSYGRNPMDMSRNRNIVFWGFNAKTSSPHQWALATLARKVNGSRIIVVDPRESETAEIADLWISPRPGSDVALAYGLARYLIINKIVDMDFIERYTHGYETYKEEALCWTPDRVQAISGVRWSEIEVLGDLLRESPSVFMIGLGLNKSLTGAESCRAVSLLPTLLGEHRGFYYTNSRGTYIQGDPYGSTLTERKPRVVSMVSLGERLASGQFKFVYVVGMNPVLTLPDANNVAAGFKREDCFLVVHDTHFTETTKLADVILPATTYLEKNDVYVSDCHPFIRLGTKAIEPIAESMDEHRLMTELAQRLKLDEPWVTADPWLDMEKNFHEAFCEGEFSDLLEGKYLKIRYRSLDEYQTQTGKIEFTTTSAPFGVSQLPKQIELDIREGEFIMLNSSLPQYTHTQFRDVYGKIINMIWMNPVDAERLSIEDSENHVMYNERGKIRVKIKVTIKVQEGVVWAPRELVDDEGNIQNSLTRGVAQVIGGGPIFNSVKVRFQS